MRNNSLNILVGIVVFSTLPQTINAQWVDTKGLDGRGIWRLVVRDSTIFAGTDSGVYISENNGTDWTAFNAGLTNTIISSFAFSKTNIFVGTYGGGVFVSDDSGTSWTAINSGLKNNYVISLAIKSDTIFASTHRGVYRSTNNGLNWVDVTAGLFDTLNGYQLAVNGDGNILAGGIGGVCFSANNGETWAQMFSYTTPRGQPCAVDFLSAEGSDVFVCYQYWDHVGIYGIVLSTNNGKTWSLIKSNYEQIYYTSLTGNSTGNIFVGTDSNGVSFSNDNGTNWTTWNNGLTDTSISFLTQNDRYIFAGTYSHGVWRRPLSEATVTRSFSNNQLQRESPLNLTISPRSNQNVAINFNLPHSEQVLLNVYNLSGNKIATIVDKNLGSGAHSVNWNRLNKPAGCYIIRLKAGSDTYARSFLLGGGSRKGM